MARFQHLRLLDMVEAVSDVATSDDETFATVAYLSDDLPVRPDAVIGRRGPIKHADDPWLQWVLLQQGWPIATSIVQGACKNLVKDRMERSGMR